MGPVAWATNDAFHPAYLPDEVWWIYLPLAPLLKIDDAADHRTTESTMLQAHETLVSLHPANAGRFRDVLIYLRESVAQHAEQA